MQDGQETIRDWFESFVEKQTELKVSFDTVLIEENNVNDKAKSK